VNLADIDPIDAFGELLFGRRLRLRVLLWANSQTKPFNQSEAARGVGYNSSGEVAKDLERFVQLGMLRKFGRTNRVGPQNYLRVGHAGWDIAGAVQSAVEKERSDRSGSRESEETQSGPEPAQVGRGGPSHERVRDIHSGEQL
jgi:hypothetical protein